MRTESYGGLNRGHETHIGPYRLLQQIGEGGFGIVYLAEQDQPVHRRVAVKVLKPGMDSAQVIARFEAERQALALMDHPNIAKVHDAGTTEEGRPYFVMELVHGVHMTKYCDDNHFTVRERLELFVPVCRAIQHAHQKGVIHRDLKPSNVLVCVYDGRPVPKVIDFGVAKATEQSLTERTMFTQYGQMIGTFEYMSPEQAEMSPLGIDTRSDIYSLGVMLYELLIGSTPLQRQRWQGARLADLLKMVKEEEPPRPSTWPSSTKEAAGIAASRRTEAVKLAKLLRGELDWVVMKCLEKDRTRRYDTANGLARDIERYLHDEPVEAGPPGAGYRLRKLALKHRSALGIAGLFVALLLLAACLSIWQAVRATRAERQALIERDRTEQEKNRAEIERNRAEVERNRAEASFKMARDTVDRFFTQVGESPQLKAQGMEKFRKDLLANAKDFYERFIREQLGAPEVHHDLALAHIRLAKINEVLADYSTARALSEKAIEILGGLARMHPETAEYQSNLAASYFELGAVYFDTGNLDEAEASYQQALAIQEKLAKDHPEVAEYRRALAATQDGLGFLDFRVGRLEKAQASLEQALATWHQLLANDTHVPEDRHGLARVQLRLATTYEYRSQTEKAEGMLKGAVSTCKALVHDYPDVPEYWHSLALAHRKLGGVYFLNMQQFERAEAAHQQATQIFEKLVKEHPDVLEYVYQLGACYNNLALDAKSEGRLEAALTRVDQAIEVLEQVVARGYGEARTELLDNRINRASFLAIRGEHTRATTEANVLAQEANSRYSHLYNIACIFAQASAAVGRDTRVSLPDQTRLKAQYADRAMDFLRKAVGKGFQDAPGLKGDPDLASLRLREDFKMLMHEVENKSKK
jgi:tetratricopeptide (TPR) repeat protein/tRNA A-37 threonylcarbamoyl transferase component Bud32